MMVLDEKQTGWTKEENNKSFFPSLSFAQKVL